MHYNFARIHKTWRFAALGSEVMAVRRHADRPIPPGVGRVVTADQLHEVLPQADVVVISAPQTGLTRGRSGENELSLMRPDSVLINVSRGQLVDEGALDSGPAEGDDWRRRPRRLRA